LIGGIASPRRRASASRSQRYRTRQEVGRKQRPKPRRRPTVPTIVSSRIACGPSWRWPRQPSEPTISSNGTRRPLRTGRLRRQFATAARNWCRLAQEVILGV
jgi:hypothetical protein